MTKPLTVFVPSSALLNALTDNRAAPGPGYNRNTNTRRLRSALWAIQGTQVITDLISLIPDSAMWKGDFTNIKIVGEAGEALPPVGARKGALGHFIGSLVLGFQLPLAYGYVIPTNLGKFIINRIQGCKVELTIEDEVKLINAWNGGEVATQFLAETVPAPQLVEVKQITG